MFLIYAILSSRNLVIKIYAVKAEGLLDIAEIGQTQRNLS